jgi:hypothetical protein
MSVTVRTVLPTPTEGERQYDLSAVIGDVVHDNGDYWDTSGPGDLNVYTKAENILATYPHGHWFGVVDSDPDSDESAGVGTIP